MNTYTVGVTVELVDKVSAAMGLMTRNLLKGQMAADVLNKRLGAIKSMYAGGLMMIGAGAAIAAPLMKATSEAAKLEQALKRVQVTTNSNMRDMNGFSELLSKVSDKTAVFSKVDLANFSSEMASSGIRSVKDIRALLPMFAQSADILKVTSHTSPEQTAHTLSALAHQFGKYSPKEMEPIVRAVTALAPMLPGGMKGFTTMGGYVNILGNRVLKIDPVQLMTLQAAAMQTAGGGGSGARGSLSGSTIINALTRTLPGVFGSGLLSGKSSFALASMGMTTADGRSRLMKNGGLDLIEMMRVLRSVHEDAETAAGRVAIARRMLANAPMLGKKAGEVQTFANAVIKSGGNVAPAELTMKLFQWAFGAAGRAAAVMSDDKFQNAMGFMGNRVKNYKGIDKTQEELMQTYMMQTTRLQTNIGTLMSTIGTQALPTLTKLASAAADWVSKLNTILEKNPRISQMLVYATAAASALLTLSGVLMVARATFMSFAFIGPVFRSLPMVIAGARMALTAFSFLCPPLRLGIIAVTVALAAYMLVSKNWGTIIAFCKAHTDQFRAALALLLVVFPALRVAINLVASALKQWPSICSTVQIALARLGVAFGVIGNIAGFIASKLNIKLPAGPSKNWVDSQLSGIDALFNKAPGVANKSGKGAGGQAGKPPVISNNININVHNNGKKDIDERRLASLITDHLNNVTQTSARSVTSGGGLHMSRYETGGGFDIG